MLSETTEGFFKSDKQYYYEFEENVPDIDADFNHWSKMPYWSLEESVALLLGKDPESLCWDVVQHHQEFPYTSDLSLNYAKLRDLLIRAFEMKEISDPTTPEALLRWAEVKGLEIPTELLIQVKTIKNNQSAFDEETNNLLQEKGEEIAKLKQRVTELEELTWSGFDESLSTHAKELAIAVRAHSAISKSWKKGMSIKKQISIWLKQNHPELPNEAQERVSKICNWQKCGGAPSTP